jgi:hypothetical protein
MLRKSFTFLALGLIALASSSSDAVASVAITTTTAPANTGSSNTQSQVLGFSFNVKDSITITSLGVYDPIGNTTITGTQVVYLADVSTGAVLAQTTILNNPAPVPGAFGYGAITPTVIANLTDTYEVYSFFVPDAVKQYAGITPTYNGTDITNFSGGFNNGTFNPATAPTLFAFPALLVTNFQYTPTAVPEPASIGMMGLGLVGAMLIRRKMAKRSA